MKSELKKLITTAVVNPNDSSAFQAEIVDCGFIKAPKATLTFDTTIYRYLSVQKEKVGIRNTSTGFRYEGITERRLAVQKETAGIRNTVPGIRYDLITEIRTSVQRESAAVRQKSSGMNYEQGEPSPI